MMLWTAFSLGLLGSMHCLGMCSPIAIALPYPNNQRGGRLPGILLYNSGRMVTYSAMGLLFGLLGKGLFLAGVQQIVSILLGVSLLVIALFSINIESWLLSQNLISRFYVQLRAALGRLFKKRNYSSVFLVGLLNGFLPCGLVYMALIGAVASAGIWQGMLYMALFGLGTFPMMMAAAWSGPFLGQRVRRWYQQLYPVMLFAFGVLFILRGLQFQLPKDFFFWASFQTQIMCH